MSCYLPSCAYARPGMIDCPVHPPRPTVLFDLTDDASYELNIDALREQFVWPDDPVERDIIGCALGLAGEAGEFANKVKKLYLKGGTSGTPVTVEELLDELGDIQAYSAMLATNLRRKLVDVRRMNLTKLVARRRDAKDQTS